METVTEELKHRSVSQLKQYERCPYSYKLARIERAWRRPAAWTAQGVAVHAAIEAWERSGRQMSLEEGQEVFREKYKEEIDAACEITPNFEWWFASGRYGGALDIARRYDIGLDQVARYMKWANGHPDEVIWINEDGTPGIELEFDIDLDGVQIQGVIDAVLLNGCGDEVYIRDHKTGNQPGDDFQLGVYKVALEEQFGVFAPSGDYWMGRSGKPTYPFDLTHWTRDKVAERFKELDENIKAERFDPKPSPENCRFCDVSYNCPFAVG